MPFKTKPKKMHGVDKADDSVNPFGGKPGRVKAAKTKGKSQFALPKKKIGRSKQ